MAGICTHVEILSVRRISTKRSGFAANPKNKDSATENRRHASPYCNLTHTVLAKSTSNLVQGHKLVTSGAKQQSQGSTYPSSFSHRNRPTTFLSNGIWNSQSRINLRFTVNEISGRFNKNVRGFVCVEEVQTYGVSARLPRKPKELYPT